MLQQIGTMKKTLCVTILLMMLTLTIANSSGFMLSSEYGLTTIKPKTSKRIYLQHITKKLDRIIIRQKSYSQLLRTLIKKSKL